MAGLDRRQLGTSGVWVSRVGLGGYQLGPEPHEDPDPDRAARVINVAIECGVNWLDTSENYLATRNEQLIGTALTRVSGEFLIASKVAPGAGVTGGGSGFRREQVLQACEDSLARLGRDQIDIYFLHWPDRSIPLEETWGAMTELVDRGLVRAIGLSNHSLEEVSRCHEQRPVDAVQVGLNLIDYLDDRRDIATCGEMGIAVTIYEPVASGILSGKTLEQVRAAWPGPWRESAFFKRLLSPGKAEKKFRGRRRTTANRRPPQLHRRPSGDRLGTTPARRHLSNRRQPQRQPHGRQRCSSRTRTRRGEPRSNRTTDPARPHHHNHELTARVKGHS